MVRLYFNSKIIIYKYFPLENTKENLNNLRILIRLYHNYYTGYYRNWTKEWEARYVDYMYDIFKNKPNDLYNFIIINIPYLYEQGIINLYNTKFISFIVKNIFNFIKLNIDHLTGENLYYQNYNDILKCLILILNYKKLHQLTKKFEFVNNNIKPISDCLLIFNKVIDSEFFEIIDEKYSHIYKYISYKIYKYMYLNNLTNLQVEYEYEDNLDKYYINKLVLRCTKENAHSYIEDYVCCINQFISLHNYKTKDFGKLRKLFLLLVIYKYL